jgi:hypothetical protein
MTQEETMTREKAVALVRKAAGKPGLFRAVIGTELAEAITTGQVEDEDALQLALAVATATDKLSH